MPYIFPPFNQIARVINKIKLDDVDKALMVVPFWPTQNWFPLLLSVLISLPARLPQHKDLLVMPHSGELHPLRKLRLVGCIVSGRDCCVQDFHQRLLMSSLDRGNRGQLNNTSYLGKNTLFGVTKEIAIHSTRLKL